MDLDELREIVKQGKNPRVHPNGFIQLDLGEVEDDWHKSHKRGHSGAATRLHIWNPPGIELPHQGTTNEIHDHVFDMRSTIVRGALEQRLYEFVTLDDLPDDYEPTHELYQAVYKKSGDSRLQSTGKKGALRLDRFFSVSQGSSYVQPAFTLHDTGTPFGLVVTYMEKTEIHDGDAHVVCPIDQPPDNSFDRASAMSEEDLWQAIEISLQ
jgi:hypothetical protein